MSQALRSFGATVLAPYVVTRLLLLATGLFAVQLSGFPLPSSFGAWGIREASPHAWLDIWTRFDGWWYLSVARDGYGQVADGHSNLAFAPLLPMAMRLVAAVLGRQDVEGVMLAGVLVSNTALLVALGFLAALVRRDFSEALARRTVWYLLVFPTSFFLSAVYPESLFLACAIASLYFARGGRWWLAGACAAGATLARPQGGLTLLPVAYEYLAQRQLRLSAVRADGLALALPPAALAAWLGSVAWLMGDPRAFARALEGWGRVVGPPATGGPGGIGPVVDAVFPLAFAPGIVACWRWLPRSYAVQATAFGVSLFASGELISSPRHVLMLFPVFVVLALVGRFRVVHQLYLATGTLLSMALMGIFALWWWVA